MPAFDTANQQPVERAENGVFLRPYRAGDFTILSALDKVCFAPKFRFSTAMMRRVLGAQGAVVHVACLTHETGAEAVVGFCAAALETRGRTRVGYVATLDVAPASRGRGIGRLLLLTTERDLAGGGATEMRLHVYAANTAAIRLYHAAGYLLLRREANFYGPGDDALAYRKPLTP